MNRWLRRLHEDQRGVGLVESLVSSALLGIALVALMSSLSTFAIASRSAEDRAIGQTIARAQAARITAAPYRADGDYSAYYDALPTGFARLITVEWWDGTSAWTGSQNANGLQKVAMTIDQAGSPLATIEFSKASR
jgi:Tfp pilus assembly protein PilV